MACLLRWSASFRSTKGFRVKSQTNIFSSDVDLWKLERYNPRNNAVTTINIKEGVKMPEEVIGKVTDFFARPVVAGIELTGLLKQEDKIHIVGHTTDMEFVVGSMQVNNVNVAEAKKGDLVGIKVSDRVRRGDTVYKVTD